MKTPDFSPGTCFRALVLCTIVALYALYLGSTIALLIVMHSPHQSQILAPGHELAQSDFAMFWYSGKRLWINFLNIHGGHATPTPWMIHTFQTNFIVSSKLFELTWLYPPTMSLLAVLFGIFPLGPSFWIWRAIFLTISACLLRRANLSWPVIIMGLAGTAELHDLVGGENGALTGGLLAASLLMIDKKPIFSGLTAACLSIKPQLGFALPFIFLRRKRGIALMACIAGVALLALMSLMLQNWQAWLWFFTQSRHSSVELLSQNFENQFPAAGATVFFMARSFSASLTTSWVMQACSSALAALLITRLWTSERAAPASRAALTLCLWVLLTPYGYIYDLVGFSIGMAAMFAKAPFAEKPIYGLLWLAPGYSITAANITGHILMPLAAAAGAYWIFTRDILPRPADPAAFVAPPHDHNRA